MVNYVHHLTIKTIGKRRTGITLLIIFIIFLPFNSLSTNEDDHISVLHDQQLPCTDLKPINRRCFKFSLNFIYPGYIILIWRCSFYA